MKVAGVLDALQRSLAQSDAGLSFRAESSFAGSLRLGEVIRGKVMRQYAENRYAMSFGGQERIVDSAVPLSFNELVYGRVVGLDDRVHLRRVFPENQQVVGVPSDAGGEVRGNELDALLDRYRIELSPGDRRVMEGLARASSQPELMALSATVLNKLGIAVTPELARAIYRVLERGLHLDMTDDLLAASPRLQIESDSGGATAKESIAALSTLLRDILTSAENDEKSSEDIGPGEPSPEGVKDENGAMGAFSSMLPDEDGGEGREQGEKRLGQYLLNVQGGGSVAHRLAALPLWFGDRLVEVSMAFFSQDPSTSRRDGIQHRKLVISLDTEGLGRIDVTAYLANRHVRLEIAAGNESSSTTLAQYMPELRRMLGEMGWTLDEADYVMIQKRTGDQAARAVVQHHLAHDSLSRLI